MSIKVNCPHCDQAYTLVDAQAGKKIRCKACTTVFDVPAPDLRRDVSRREEDRDDYDDRPRRRERHRPSGTPGWVWVAIGGGVLLLLVVGGGLVVLFSTGVLGNKITKENVAKVQMGMSEVQVKAILGSPTETNDAGLQGLNPFLGGNIRVLVWRHGGNQVSVTLIGDKVSGISSMWRN
jgi:predicted Zn finger-like uncharacterized protein